eukprot:2947836-Rhodomonas_salina.1
MSPQKLTRLTSKVDFRNSFPKLTRVAAKSNTARGPCHMLNGFCECWGLISRRRAKRGRRQGAGFRTGARKAREGGREGGREEKRKGKCIRRERVGGQGGGRLSGVACLCLPHA